MPSADADLIAEPAAAASAGSELPVIEIDPEIPGHVIGGRCDWLIRGRVLSRAPAEEIGLLADGETIALFGFGRPATNAKLSDDGPRAAVFHLHLSRPADSPIENCVFTLVARADDGAERAESFTLEAHSADGRLARVVRGPAQAMEGADGSRPPTFLHVERATCDHNGRLRVHGWVVSLTPVLAVAIGAEGARIGPPRVNCPRPDVAAILPMYPNAATSGFALDAPAALPDHVDRITVRAISRDGVTHEVVRRLERLAAPAPPAPVPPAAPDPRRRILSHCDFARLSDAGELRIEGWAVCAAGIAEVAIALDGVPAGIAEIGLPRPDVGEGFPRIPFARLSGFRLRHHLGAIDAGPHQLRLTIRNGMDDTATDERWVETSEIPATFDLPAPSAEAEDDEFKFQLDLPTVVDGAVIGMIAGRMTIEGWALTRSGIAGVEVHLDDARIGAAHIGLVRQDVGAAYPEWTQSLRSGFAFHCPPRALKDGPHEVALIVRAVNGKTLTRRFAVTVRKTETDNQLSIRTRVPAAEADLLTRVLDHAGYHPRFHLLIRYRPDASLATTLGALDRQAYGSWSASILVGGKQEKAAAIEALRAAELTARVRVLHPVGKHHDQRLVDVAEQAEWLGVLSSGDELGADALLEAALAGAQHPDADLIYADEQRISPASGEREAFFKPDFAPDLLLSTNYIGRPWFVSPGTLARCAITLRDLAALGEYDALLQLAETARRIEHIPKLLCQRGAAALDDPGRERGALARAATRRGVQATILEGCAPGIWRFKRHADHAGQVCIIIPTCGAHGHIRRCIETLRAKTGYRDFEIVVIDNVPDDQPELKAFVTAQADRVVNIPGAFNWSRFNNLAAREARADFLLFLNDDTEIIEPDWLDAMLEHASRPEVGVVGARLLYPDRTVQHGGMFLAEPGIARHAFRFVAETEPGYFGLALTQRNVIAVTGACLLVRRETFEALGRFDESHTVVNNDVDFCLRAHRAGLANIYTPHSTLIHHEFASRSQLSEEREAGDFARKWSTTFAAGDPFLSPRLFRHTDELRPDDEPVQAIIPGPLFRNADIKRILIVKLDHIGDFITALPAVRRLKALFPSGSFDLLASPGTCAIAADSFLFDRCIEFQFFHSRSQLGVIELSEEQLAALARRLAACRYDLAIDLRKQPDTRAMLRRTGARLLAGYDHMGAFPYLDIAIEWEGDRSLQPKRAHVSFDLLRLVAGGRRRGRRGRGRASGSDRRARPGLARSRAARVA